MKVQEEQQQRMEIEEKEHRGLNGGRGESERKKGGSPGKADGEGQRNVERSPGKADGEGQRNVEKPETGLPRWPSGQDPTFPMQKPTVQSLVRAPFPARRS